MSEQPKPKKIGKKKKQPAPAEDGTTHPKRDNFECELDEQAVTVDNNGKVYEFSMDARDFLPEDIKVKITDKTIFIEGCHETDDDIVEINEEIDIHPQIIHSTLEVVMNRNGVLRIRGKMQPKEEEMRTVIVSEQTITRQVQKQTITTRKQTVTYETDMEVKVKRLTAAEEKKILTDAKFEDSTKEMKVKDGKIELNVDMTGHRHEDIKVSVSDTVVAIQAVAHYEIENPPKEIHKKYLIPDGIDPTTFRSMLKKGGNLNVTGEELKPEPKKVEPKEPPPPPPPKIPTLPPSAANEPITYCWIKSQVVEDAKDVEELAQKCEDITTLVSKVENKKFEANIEVLDFKAEELRLKITKEYILIHSETRTPKRQFFKKIKIPAGVQPQGIKNKMTPKYALLSLVAKVTA